MLREIRDLGFEYAELSHGIRLSLLPGILESVAAGEIKISTLHNFCPLPIGVNRANPNVFKFTSTDARERENAWRYSLKTLETAEEVGARLVVLHMGAVEMRNYTEKMESYIERGLQGTPKYERLCMEMMEKRESRKERHEQLAYEFLHRLVPEAEKRGLLLGIENREAVEEIPFETDFPMFFREFPESTVCYWHDFGHAQIKENLGLIMHGMHLGAMSERMAGCHIHDVEFPGRDHQPPGSGNIDFAGLAKWVKPDHIKVLEMSPRLSEEEVMGGLAHLRGLWGDL
ncbi:MAG: hypothetical protein RI897_311 [Verrucomicrobiota bacterium]|jgi:sugar phosphate isomerase/epimerase